MVNNSEKFKDDHNKQDRISSKNVLESRFFNTKTKNTKLILNNCDEAIKLQPTRRGVSNPIIAKLYASAWDQRLPDMGGKGGESIGAAPTIVEVDLVHLNYIKINM